MPTAKLTHAELDAAVATLPFWKLEAGKLVRDWTFPDFVEAMTFVNRVATIAEQANHHPDIDIRYNQVVLGLVSHDAGGVTQRDASMASQLNQEFPPA
jgi:4a-hydroxytetrahydrobiopterin dehydratase